jgi:hypothetical protein
MRRAERTIFTIFTITLVLKRGSYLVVCSGDEHLWVGEVYGGDFSPMVTCSHVTIDD